MALISLLAIRQRLKPHHAEPIEVGLKALARLKVIGASLFVCSASSIDTNRDHDITNHMKHPCSTKETITTQMCCKVMESFRCA